LKRQPGKFYAKNSVCGLSCDLSLQAEAEKFMETLSGLWDTFGVPACLREEFLLW
jgi:hypothetical protein